VNSATSDYSHVSLITKLGFLSQQTVCLIGAPETLSSYLRNNNIKLVKHLPADWLQLFCMTESTYLTTLEELDVGQARLGLWLCWPKKTSGLQTDLTEHSLRNSLLPLDWVDIKVCAIDETWSALQFVRRKA
jgi:hypothetical protein